MTEKPLGCKRKKREREQYTSELVFINYVKNINKRMDYTKNCLSFLRAKIKKKQNRKSNIVRSILVNKDDYGG